MLHFSWQAKWEVYGEHNKRTEYPNRPKNQLVPTNVSARRERTSNYQETFTVGS
jgi:hypothetical protein